MTFARILGAGMSCWVLGCGVQDGSPQGGSEKLCPTCTPLSGGETSDFGGGQENCRETALPLSAAMRTELGVDEILASLAEPFSAPLRFQLEHGQRGDTTLTATASFGRPEYKQIGVDESDACRDSVRIPVTLNALARDGAFTANAVGALQVRRGDLSWRLLAAADLAETTGNLELEIDQSRPHLGELALDIKGLPGGPRGDVRMRLYYPGAGAPTNRIPGQDEAPGSDFVSTTLGYFPADRCGSNQFPIENDEPHDWLAGATARELYAAAREGVPVVSVARWRDGSTTDITVTFDELPASGACLGDSFGNARLTFDSSARLRTEDGRVDAEIIGSDLALLGNSGIVDAFASSRTLHSLTLSQVEAEAGIGGLEVSDEDRLTVAFELRYDPEGGADSGGGIIDVIDDSSNQRVDCVAWPVRGRYEVERCASGERTPER